MKFKEILNCNFVISLFIQFFEICEINRNHEGREKVNREFIPLSQRYV